MASTAELVRARSLALSLRLFLVTWAAGPFDGATADRAGYCLTSLSLLSCFSLTSPLISSLGSFSLLSAFHLPCFELHSFNLVLECVLAPSLWLRRLSGVDRRVGQGTLSRSLSPVGPCHLGCGPV